MTEQTIHARTTDQFWMVWTKNGKNPRKTHTTLDAARAEARRLAAPYPDRRWFVLANVERVWVNEAPERWPTGDEERDLNPAGWPQ